MQDGRKLRDAIVAAGMDAPKLVELANIDIKTATKFLGNPEGKFQSKTLTSIRRILEEPIDPSEPDVLLPGALSAIAREERWTHDEVLLIDHTELRPVSERSREDWKKLRRFLKESPHLFVTKTD